MDNQLSVVDGTMVLSPEEKKQLVDKIDNMIEANKTNRLDINRLVFECTACLTEADDTANKIKQRGWFRRLIGRITGGNTKLQNKVSNNMIAAQYASQVTLQKIAEQNLLTFDLITAVNNKLNATIETTNNKFRNQLILIGKFFLKNRSDIINLEVRLSKVEKNVQLLNWQGAIEYQTYNDIEYKQLDDISKIVCLARDFYDITKGKWSGTDLMLLKTAMKQIGMKPSQKINYISVIKGIALNPELKNKLYGNRVLRTSIDSTYLVSFSAIERMNSFENKDKAVVATVEALLKESGIQPDLDIIKMELTSEYMKNTVNLNLDYDVDSYDILLDLLYNLNQLYEEKMLKLDIDAFKLFLKHDPKEVFESIKELASEENDAKALYVLGRYYENGFECVQMNDEKAVEYYKQAYKAGYIPAGYELVERMQKDSSKRNELLSQIKDEILARASSGEAVSQYLLSKMYYYGDGVEKSLERAFSMAKDAAKCGDGMAQIILGNMYKNGEGTQKSDFSAFECFDNITANRSVLAQRYIGHMYYAGEGTKESKEKALKYFLKAEKQGDTALFILIGNMYYYGEGAETSYAKAYNYYIKASEINDIKAMNAIGDIYHHGYGVVEVNLYKAIEWFEKAAALGDDNAQLELGYIYWKDFNHNIKANKNEALKWFMNLVNKGNIKAQHAVAIIYAEKVVRGEFDKFSDACYWLKKEADRDDVEAEYYLGVLYLNNGIGWSTNLDDILLNLGNMLGTAGKNLLKNELGMNIDEKKMTSSLKEARKWFDKAYKYGGTQIQNKIIDYITERSTSCSQLYKEAIEKYFKQYMKG
jgi:TPR repeat protein